MTPVPGGLSGSLRARLMVGYLIVVAVLAGAWGWSLARPLTEAILEQHRVTLTSVARAGALVVQDSDIDPQDAIEHLVADTDVRVTLVAADGTVMADSEGRPLEMENHADRPEIAAALSGRIGEDRRVSETQGTERLYIAVPAVVDGEPFALRASESIARISAIAARSRRDGLVLLALALAIASLIVTKLTAVATEPILRLSDSARSMARGDLVTPIPNEPGDLSVLSGALTDLREQMKRRLDDLQAEQHNLREVLDGLTDAVFLLHDDRIRFVNNAARELFPGRKRDWHDVGIGEFGLPASVVSAIEAEKVDHSSAEYGPDPSGRYLRVTTLPLNPSDGIRRTLVVIADVTERVTIDQVRRDFVANASHELKTPTAGIRLLAESAATAASDGDSDLAIEFAGRIADESARLSRLVGDLLDLSRLDSTPSPGSVTDVRESIANAILAHRASAERRGLSLDFSDAGAAGLDAYARTQPADVAVALDNLLDNAITYTEHGGVTVSLEVDADNVRVSVTDTGIGIPGKDLARIFERFYRVDRARSRESGGTGLGLALVKHVAERAGGSVDVRSSDGEGSTFTIAFPRAK